jgi:hypothetical protein
MSIINLLLYLTKTIIVRSVPARTGLTISIGVGPAAENIGTLAIAAGGGMHPYATIPGWAPVVVAPGGGGGGGGGGGVTLAEVEGPDGCGGTGGRGTAPAGGGTPPGTICGGMPPLVGTMVDEWLNVAGIVPTTGKGGGAEGIPGGGGRGGAVGTTGGAAGG